VNANGLHQDIGYVGQAAGRAVQKDGEGRGAAKVSRRSGARRYSLRASEGRTKGRFKATIKKEKTANQADSTCMVAYPMRISAKYSIAFSRYYRLSWATPASALIAIPYSTWQRPSTWYSWALSVPRKVNPTQGSTGV
jgi:hypothetical protein